MKVRCEGWKKCRRYYSCARKEEHNYDTACGNPCNGLYGAIEGAVCKPVEQEKRPKYAEERIRKIMSRNQRAFRFLPKEVQYWCQNHRDIGKGLKVLSYTGDMVNLGRDGSIKDNMVLIWKGPLADPEAPKSFTLSNEDVTEIERLTGESIDMPLPVKKRVDTGKYDVIRMGVDYGIQINPNEDTELNPMGGKTFIPLSALVLIPGFAGFQYTYKYATMEYAGYMLPKRRVINTKVSDWSMIPLGWSAKTSDFECHGEIEPLVPSKVAFK